MDTGGNGTTTGGQDDNIIFDEFLNEGDMLLIMLGPGIVTADDTGDTADTAVDDIVVQGEIIAAETAAQMVFDRLNTKTGNLRRFVAWES
jgi:hypothetical protein